MRSTYRADIDGLRGVAVLSVLMFHAGSARFSGGYVGVDVFFVISGFLITSIILREIDNQSFSVARFYERRVRRIFPALFLTIALSSAAAALLLTPAKLKAMAESVVAVTAFGSNLLFWREAGYFDPSAGDKPLLHTWSLAVEEQFYIVFPLLLVAIRRFGRSRISLWLCVCALLSLALDVYASYTTPVGAFYLAPLRAWELMVGAIVASGELPVPSRARTRNALAWIGIALIVGCVFEYDAETVFPGIAALAPTIGAALLIHVGTTDDALVTRWLGAAPLVFVGLISYSLYLLHWPFIVFTRYVLIREVPDEFSAAVVPVTIALAALSWRLVEQPCRSIRMPRRRVFAFAGAAMMATLAAGGVIVAEDGFPLRFPYGGTRSRGCDFRSPVNPAGVCALGSASPATFLLWGDSHAAALSSGIATAALRKNAAGYLVSKSGCPPLVGIEVEWGPARSDEVPSCLKFNEDTLRYVRTRPDLHEIILSARWTLYAEGRGYLSDKDSLVTLARSPSDSEWTNRDLFKVSLERTVGDLRAMGRQVVLISPVPEVGYDVPEALFIAERTGRDVNDIIAPTVSDYRARNHVVEDALKIFQDRDVQVVDVASQMCDGRRCRVAESGRPWYEDDTHLSIYGSQHLSPLFEKLFREAPPNEHPLAAPPVIHASSASLTRQLAR